MVETGQGGPTPGGDSDRGPLLLGVLWTQAGIATVIVFLRLYARFMIHTTGWDDWLMFLTLAIFIGSIIIATLQDSVGGYRHVYYLDEDAVVRALELNFILRGVHIIGYATGKASIGAFILRLIGPQNMWQKWVVWVLIIFTTLVNVLNCENIAADAVLAIIPATFLFSMNLSLKKRINLTILLGLGSMATICGIVKTIELNSIRDDPDFTWGLYAVTVWALSEIFVIIACGSVPALKPLWDWYIVRRFSENNSECHGNWFENYRMRHLYQVRLQSGSTQAKHTPKSESTSKSLWSSDPGVQTTTSTTKQFNINTAGEREIEIETIQEPQSAV
ncbi:hypothetical protein CNMCM8980_009671 [Aspergillus fumigatiaffinis]|nr:hypothetical protein CNMCM6457_002437 [Aspergillus fumigatiaffinis]KAF4221224.1 hypothetical protein CNMCM5878_010021 [Aspergillus fumigatiaffinis]KAF4245440.1 hypothetical protein CNMCM8980_009671 [Aspergillus fumigatiaffinis]